MSADQLTESLAALRQAVSQAKGVPMSASCVVNRAEMLELLDRIQAALPTELERANRVLADSEGHRDQGRTDAEQIVADARQRAEQLATEHEITRQAREQAERLRNEAEEECRALRRETDIFIDSRMASFESVLHKTSSQVAVARQRLAERSGLDAETAEPLPPA
ncbi:ATP synthase subunit B family protein [Enemella evansiae]|uniref:ATPase n=1 Tax=Enemella evansiae TaxID=2016499 RepID=A0A255G2H5_9ACTN|nr:hypothetical protein [Enemella evansiae]OYN93553.1 hypothetical protein CGZ95_19670 [Enemella evansiae]OYO05780.1 hypothetical protein CGZ97_03535 [Enemella evansiae]OYO09692.1 hypothetical protein CGZ94_18755 [Enemella evansiae]OYO15072.1 hypothetical protein CGZ98_01100 [Enemella evansiae]OYO20143.1 hypothetical protein BI335_00820 [Enemella evansiae]